MGLFTRMRGQSVGAAMFGGMLNLGLARSLPGAGDVVERLMEPGQRASLGAASIARLAQAVASLLHQVYLVPGLLAPAALALSPVRSIPITAAGVVAVTAEGRQVAWQPFRRRLWPLC